MYLAVTRVLHETQMFLFHGVYANIQQKINNVSHENAPKQSQNVPRLCIYI